MQIGDYKIYSLKTGLFKLDGGAMFGVIPKPLWNRTNPADDSNRIEMSTNSLLLDNGKRKILIDTGIGNKLNKKQKEIYAVEFKEYTLARSLEKINISLLDITDVILSHLHFDHCGGSTYFNENKELKITFPNAKYYIQEKHLEWALNPTERDKASYFENDFVPLINNKLLFPVNGEYKLDDYISLKVINGHTPYMQIVKISDGENTLIYMADLIPMSSHISLPYIMGYDLLPLVTLNEKKYFLNEAVENNWMLYFEHDPYIECAAVGYNGNQYYLKNKIEL